MRPFGHTLAAICLTSFFVPAVPAVAFADAPVATRAAARAAEGHRLMTAHNYAAACPKFAESQSLVPAPETALALGLCYEKAGKLASAWSAFKTAAASAVAAHQKARALAARKLMSGVASKMSRLTLHVPDSARVAGLEIRCDDETVDPADWDNALPRDGGGHDIQASAPGKKAWRTHVDLQADGKTVTVDVPALEDQGGKGPPSPVAKDAKESAPEAGEGSVAQTSTSPDDGVQRGHTQRLVGVVVGGVGVAGLAAGIIAGISANSANGDLKSACGTGPTCSANNASLHDSAITWATISDIAFAAGGAAVAAGTVIYLTAPHDASAVSSVGIAPASRGAGLSLVGRF